MMYKINLIQRSLREYGDGKKYEHEESMKFTFTDRDDMQNFLYYVSIGSPNTTTAEIEFIKED